MAWIGYATLACIYNTRESKDQEKTPTMVIWKFSPISNKKENPKARQGIYRQWEVIAVGIK